MDTMEKINISDTVSLTSLPDFLGDFSNLKSTKDGKAFYCKNCYREYRLSKIEHYRAKHKEYVLKNKDRLSSQNKELYKRNREKILEQRRDYYRRNREAVKARRSKYYYANKEKCIQKAIISDFTICLDSNAPAPAKVIK